MYKIENGILYKDGKKIFALGQSYYPSFHPCKFPVPPEGDRIGEMKKDLALMAEVGFNHVRFAALGEVNLLENGEVSIKTDFIDVMTEEAMKNDISVSIREQGFAVNLRGFKNVEMIDWNGKTQTRHWTDFIRTTPCHEGVLEDNRIYASALAKHFKKHQNVVAYQIYNEPHFPGTEIYDYHEESISAYRKWLVDKGYMTNEEVKDYQPPCSRKEQGEHLWALWRLFARDSLSNFLNNASNGSKMGSNLATYTCFTTDQLSNRAAYRSCDLFANAKAMDIVGYTCYYHAKGVDYYAMCMFTDLAQCAAELENKQSWCIELDSRTYIPIDLYNKNTYAVIGSGTKGIVYYQWRGDCPVPGVPHPNSCGILNYDGTKTHNFDNAVNVNKYIISLNDLLMGAKRVHEGIGLLHSDYALYLADSRENGDKQARDFSLKNSYLLSYTETYRQLRQAGYNVTITDAEHLETNPLNIKVLYVPDVEKLSKEELSFVNDFCEKGGEVYTIVYPCRDRAIIGFKKYEATPIQRNGLTMETMCSVQDVADLTNVNPRIVPLNNFTGAQLLEGDNYNLIVITNISNVRQTINARVRIDFPFTKATFRAIDGEKLITINGNEIIIENVTDGGILILE